ncbi:glycosyltransferase [Geotalea sp. SG265]|uniref:glycosyltransferase family 2 protein n=1 Tax=Geotalea sp. SG265 TaxID=2922867 RepID=UPI001FAF66C3
MENNQAITIVTPTYNAAKDIEACILSVANQTYPHKEHLIVDGLSSDGTLDIVKKYSAEYPHIKFISEKDNGIYDAMNKSIDIAAGEWIYFLGADDVLFDETVLAGIFDTPYIGPFEIVYGNVLWGDTGTIYDGKFSLLKLMDKNICHQAIFYTKALFNKVGNFDLNYRTWADYLFNIKCFSSDEIRIKYIDRIVAKYGTHGVSSQMNDPDFMREKASILKANFPEEYIHIKESLSGLQQQLMECDRQLAERNWKLVEQGKKLAEQDKLLNELNQQLAATYLMLDQKQTLINAIKTSLSWKVTAPFRFVMSLFKSLLQFRSNR